MSEESKRTPGVLLMLVLAASVLCALLGLVAGRGVAAQVESGGGVQGSQMLGIIPSERGTAEGAMAATKEWAAVGSSLSFQHVIARKTGLPAGEIQKSLKVTTGENAQVINLDVTGSDRGTASKVLARTAAELGVKSKTLDARYPVIALTDPVVLDVARTSGDAFKWALPLLFAVLGGVTTFFLGRRRTLRRRS